MSEETSQQGEPPLALHLIIGSMEHRRQTEVPEVDPRQIDAIDGEDPICGPHAVFSMGHFTRKTAAQRANEKSRGRKGG